MGAVNGLGWPALSQEVNPGSFMRLLPEGQVHRVEWWGESVLPWSLLLLTTIDSKNTE